VSPAGGNKDKAAVAIETATETVGVAVRTPDGVEAEFALTGRRRHVETLTPALEHLLGQVGLVPADLGVVAVDIGPGLFTGLRVGVAAAKGLAQALSIGVVCATSLDVLTAAAGDAADAADPARSGLVLPCVDARRGEVFAAVRALGEDCETVAEPIAPALWAPGDLAAALGGLGGKTVYAVGDGAQRYREVLAGVPGVRVVSPALSFPPPSTLLRLALARLEQGEAPVDAASVVPLYMREADAKSNFVQARGETELESR
jgi:tRNA threonylcarbamoyladenosine biosynthesis protein TsaB